tara:strand:- start:387 stop:659 length:273 start_codon:yes stop_codon:yes gene_type:complete
MKEMKVRDLVALSNYGENLAPLYRYTDSCRKKRHNDNIPLRGIIVKVGERWGRKQYFVKWMKPYAPNGRDGSYGCGFFERKDLKYISKSK